MNNSIISMNLCKGSTTYTNKPILYILDNNDDFNSLIINNENFQENIINKYVLNYDDYMNMFLYCCSYNLITDTYTEDKIFIKNLFGIEFFNDKFYIDITNKIFSELYCKCYNCETCDITDINEIYNEIRKKYSQDKVSNYTFDNYIRSKCKDYDDTFINNLLTYINIKIYNNGRN